MVWWDVAEPEDLVQRAERDTKVRALGFRPTQDYVTDTYGEGWQPDAAPAPAAAGPAGAGLAALFAEAGRRQRRGGWMPKADTGRDFADDLAEQLDTVAGPAQDAMIDAIRALAMDPRITTMVELRDALVRLLPSLPTAALAELMGQAFAVASLAGRSDLTDGA
jgi:hypothetical protein